MKQFDVKMRHLNAEDSNTTRCYITDQVVEIVRGDTTRKGHILGPANTQPAIPTPERDLTNNTTALLRFFLHATMFLAANQIPQDVAELIENLNTNNTNVCDFLWEHLKTDLAILSKILAINIDEVFNFLHFIIKEMLKQGPGNPGTVNLLRSKEERREWEKAFSEEYFEPHLVNLDNILNEVTKAIDKDDRSGANNIIDLQNQVMKSVQRFKGANNIFDLQNQAQLWQYQPSMSRDHFNTSFKRQIMESKERSHYKLLDLFFEKEQTLCAVRHIPNISKLYGLLLKKYKHKMGFQVAQEMSIRDFLEGQKLVTEREECEILLNSFIESWEISRHSLKAYVCYYNKSQLPVHGDYYDHPLGLDSNLAFFIPSTKGPGICSYILLDYLLRAYNDFLEKYCLITNQSYENLKCVSLSDVKSFHVIDFDPVEDFSPLIIANSNYKIDLKQSMTVEYNFMGFQNQLKESFFYGKAKIQIEKFEVMVFSGDIDNISLFEMLDRKIKQVPMTKAVKFQIFNEYQSISSIFSDIENLEITISFLKSIGGDPNSSLANFMQEVLRFKESLGSSKAHYFCTLQHVKSLWLLLNMKKEKHLALNNVKQMSFETINEAFKISLSENEERAVTQYYTQMNGEKLYDIITNMFEFIFDVLPISQPNIHDLSLKDNLADYHDTLEEDPLFNLSTFPEDIKTKQIISTWIVAMNIFSEY